MFVTSNFIAYTSKSIEAADVYLPLSKEAEAELMQLLTSTTDAYTYLTLKDNVNIETVMAYVENGYILLCRGEAGTQAVKHPYGTCVSTVPTTFSKVIEDAATNGITVNQTSLTGLQAQVTALQSCDREIDCQVDFGEL